MDENSLKNMQASTLVIFGITGDLANRKLLPALYHLAKHNMLPQPLRIVGVTRRGTTVGKLLESIRISIERSGKQPDLKVLKKLGQMLEVIEIDLLSPDDYTRLRERLDEIEIEEKVCMSRLFYLAIPAQIFGPVVKQLGKGGLNKSCQHRTGASRLLIEKPFGYDLTSAQELIKETGKHFTEKQLYRIDHFLAKETVQNILNFRFQNPIFKRAWDNQCISHIMITGAEELDIEGRVTFYEQTGALRDLIQSHLFQLLALTTMDEPDSLSADAIHQQKLELLKSITPIAPNQVAELTVRGQYEGYRGEVENPDSVTETYAALKLEINNNRWRGVPMLVRTGKALAEKVAEITIVFSDTSHLTKDNTLTIRIQPNEGISLQLLAKKPGFTNEVEPVRMEFCYGRSFAGDGTHPDAYERVLLDAFRGDKTLFTTSDEVLASWRIIENVVQEWSKNDSGLHKYKRGSWGPEAADLLAKSAGADWLSHGLGVCPVILPSQAKPH